MGTSIFTKFIPSETNFLFYSAMKYKPKVRFRDVKKRGKTTFLFVIQGQYKYTFNNDYFIADDNSLIVVPRGADYTFKILSKYTEVMQIELDILNNNIPIAPNNNPFAFKLEQTSALTDIFEKVINLYTYKPSGYTFSINSQLFKLISLLIKHEEATLSTHKSKIYPALSYIEKNFTKSIKCSHLAKLCIMSESQLRRIFHNEIGISPIEYKRNLQIDYARTLLESNNFSITEIAEMVGFNNIYEFSTAFKKKLYKSPRDYIKTTLKS